MRFLSCSTEAKSKLVSTQILKVVYQRSEPTRRTKSPVKEVILSLQSENPDKSPWVSEPCIIWSIFSQCRICNTTDTSDTTSLLALVTKRTHNNLKYLQQCVFQACLFQPDLHSFLVSFIPYCQNKGWDANRKQAITYFKSFLDPSEVQINIFCVHKIKS